MKSHIHTTLFAVLMIINFLPGKAQNLEIKGTVRASIGMKLTVNYILKSNDKVVEEGHSKRININFDLNRNYILIIFKEGYYPRYIHFSTATPNLIGYVFEFEAEMRKKESIFDQRDPKDIHKVNVYYDQTTNSFNYALIR